MGTDKVGEKPVHEVTLDSFWIGRTEVTVAQWRAVMGSAPGKANDQGDTHPVAEVNWENCQDFCRDAGVGLPTEAQWEYAARGPEGRTWPWGSTWDPTRCQSGDDKHGHKYTAPVGSFPRGASWCGALDMAGNVWEWCQDWYSDTFYGTPEAQAKNPECKDNSSGHRVLRGGCYYNGDIYCRGAKRYRHAPDYKLRSIGFRVCLAG